MSDIADLRVKIDAIDIELLRLLNERARVAKEIGVIKSREGLPIYSPEREDRVIRSLVDRSAGPLTPEAIRAIYCEIMSAALAVEKDVAIACLGSRRLGVPPSCEKQIRIERALHISRQHRGGVP